MATVFHDDFNRADGPVGNDWSDLGASSTIATNQARSTSGNDALVRAVPTAQQSNQVVEWVTGPSTNFGGGYDTYLVLRSNSGLQNGYRAAFHMVGSNQGYIMLQMSTANNWTEIARVGYLTFGPDTYYFKMSAVGTQIQVFVNNQLYLSIPDSNVGSGTHVGVWFFSANLYMDDFWIYDASIGLYTLICSPNQVPVGGFTVPIHIEGLRGTWTPGTPGSPTFTSSAGTVDSQEVVTAYMADLVLTTPTVIGPFTIEEGTNGDLAQLQCVSTVPTGPPILDLNALTLWLEQTLQGLSDDLTDLLNAASDGETVDEGESILKWVRYIGNPTPYGTLAAILADILDHLANDHDDPTTLRSIAVDILAEIYATNGYPTRTTLPDLASAIGQIGTPDLSAITEAIEGVADQIVDVATTLNLLAGTPVTSTADLLSAIGSVQTDVGAVQGTADSIEGKLDAATGNGTYSLGGILAALGAGGLIQVVTLAVGIISLVRGGAVTALQVVDTVGDVVAAGSDLPEIVDTLFDFLNLADVPTTTTLALDVSGVLSAVNGVHDDLALDVPIITDAIDGAVTDLGSQIAALSDKVDALDAKLDALSSGGPLWPGLADVTLGTPVAISGSMRIEGSMEGIIYNVASLTPGARIGDIGGKDSVTSLGIVAFESDNGDTERFQLLSIKKGLVCPKTMLTASACVLSWRPGTTGTVTPWSRTV